jgi:aldehyde:ferredoxin oxidoreductase
MRYGYNGRILRVDLSSMAIAFEEPDENFFRTYLGGKGIGSYYLLRELKRGVEPLSPENELIFAASVITGAPAPAICRYSVVSKSPLTGGYGGSEAGGWWGPELKFGGFDAVIIEGKAEKPIYIFINDGHVEFKDAEHLWGLPVGDAEKAIREELNNKKIRILAIGPGGENLVRYACISNDLIHVNGRSGMGAVMGSKNLKAIAVRGTKSLIMKDPERVKHIAGWFAQNFRKHPLTESLRENGTHAGVERLKVIGLLPTRNFHSGGFEMSGRINCNSLKENYSIEKRGCFGCPMRCKKVIANREYGSPEYETVAAFGSNLEVSNLDVIIKANELCNKYGIDTISTGVSIAFAMECVEEGILHEKDFDGLDVRFGNEASVLKIVEMIVFRKGIGDILAEGVKRASDIIGKNSAKFAMHVKGQEMPLHDPRGKFGFGLGLAVSETGAEHNIMVPHDNAFEMRDSLCLKEIQPLGVFEPLDALDSSAKKVRLYLYLENISSLWNTLGVCNFGPVPRGVLPFGKFVDLVEGITGFETSLWELLKAGERSTVLSRSFNVMEGFRRKDDFIPNRFFEPLEGGLLTGKKIERSDFEEALTTYYRMKGYDDEGRPTLAKLQELDIAWVAEKLIL